VTDVSDLTGRTGGYNVRTNIPTDLTGRTGGYNVRTNIPSDLTGRPGGYNVRTNVPIHLTYQFIINLLVNKGGKDILNGLEGRNK
jgi:hypothetical protein